MIDGFVILLVAAVSALIGRVIGTFAQAHLEKRDPVKTLKEVTPVVCMFAGMLGAMIAFTVGHGPFWATLAGIAAGPVVVVAFAAFVALFAGVMLSCQAIGRLRRSQRALRRASLDTSRRGPHLCKTQSSISRRARFR